MAWTPVKFDSGKVIRLPVTASTTLTKFNLAKMSSGYLVAGASGDNEVEYLCLETVTDATGVAGSTMCDVVPLDDVMQLDVLCSTTPVQATHVGNDYDVSTAAVLDLGATTDKVFHVDSIVDATNKIVRGRFNRPAIA